MIASGALALLLTIGALGTAEPAQVHRYVVSVGYNRSINPKMEPLRFADDDAARWFELLSPGAEQAHLLVWFDERSSKIYTDLLSQARRPSKDALRSAFKSLRERFQADRKAGVKSELYFFYAGHGDEDRGVGHFNLSDGVLTRPEFRELLLQDGARADRIHVIIDACKSYFMISGRGPGGRREPRKELLIGPDEIEGVGLILSTSDESQSHEWSAFSSGIFSHEVRSGMIGAADVDRDGKVSYLELQAFVAASNRAVPAGFKPSVFIRGPQGGPQGDEPILFAPASQPGAWVEIDLPNEGRVTIYDDRNVRYADAHKGKGARLRLLLSGRKKYDVRWRKSSWAGAKLALGPTLNYVVAARGGAVQLSQIEASPFDPPRGDVRHDAFERVFELPFERRFYDGFEEGLASGVTAEAERLEAQSQAWKIGLLSGGIGLVTISGVLAAVSLKSRADINNNTGQVDRIRLIDRANGLAIGAGVGGALALGALSTALYLYWVGD